jgi:cobalt/nickel transport system ATP-binding protein
MVDKNILIYLNNIRFSYDGATTVLEGIYFTLTEGEKVGVVGDNGSGKTTLFKLLMGLLPCQQGTIELFGKRMDSAEDFSRYRLRMGLLFQDADDQLFSPTVLEDVAFGPLNQGKSREEAVQIGVRVLKDLGISDLAQRITHQLSGGEKRLAALATVLAMSPEVLLLDEPTIGLDGATKKRLTEILKELNVALVVISHDFDFLAEVTETIYSMHHGKLTKDEGEIMHKHFHVHSLGNYPHKHSH